MKAIRIVVVAVIVAAWVVALGSFINSIADVSTFPDVARSVLSLWPDPDTSTGTVIRFGAVAVVIAGILGFRALGKAGARREHARDDSDQVPLSQE
ncbi:hypothetical protein [Agromyces humatus]|uniref:Uncharacterized protein n=1 Tax=Agromyces humatus TaxID=279573 RepID=A0ABP4X5A8_9MICO|nr:hypothetical protein [Agromyces humatus]